MSRNKRSFFERLTGAINIGDYEDDFEEEIAARPAERRISTAIPEKHISGQDVRHEGGGPPATGWLEEEQSEGQLTVDVYQTPEDIVIRAHVAGVRPEDLDISITRDMVTIKGHREEAREVEDNNYFYKELYWGAFSRTVLLPQEIEVEEVEASEKHGLLTLRLPKIDKARQTKVKVKSS